MWREHREIFPALQIQESQLVGDEHRIGGLGDNAA